VLPYRYDSDALAEAESTAAWYLADATERIALAFSLELERSNRLIRQFPRIGTPSVRATRRLLLQGFPFAVIYEPRADEIVIVAVAHERLRPGYWLRRQ